MEKDESRLIWTQFSIQEQFSGFSLPPPFLGGIKVPFSIMPDCSAFLLLVFQPQKGRTMAGNMDELLSLPLDTLEGLFTAFQTETFEIHRETNCRISTVYFYFFIFLFTLTFFFIFFFN